MKYWDMMKVPMAGITPQPIVEQSSDSDNTETDETKTDDSNKEISDNLKTIMKMIENMSNKDNNPPPGFDVTTLKENEIADVVSWLVEFNNKYFGEIPLAEELQRTFVWNIPREVYKTAHDVAERGYPDCLNPIYWFYMFCMDIDIETIAKFVLTAYNSMTDDDFKEIETRADVYDDYIAPDDDDEDDYPDMEDNEVDDEEPDDDDVTSDIEE